jgi:hypothetical protein
MLDGSTSKRSPKTTPLVESTQEMKPIRKRPLCHVCRTITFETLSKPEGLKHADQPMFFSKDELCDLCKAFTWNQDLWHQKNFRLVLNSKEGSRYKSLGIIFDSAERSEAVSYHLLTDEVSVTRAH